MWDLHQNQSEETAPGGRYDMLLLFPVLFLVGIGIVMVYSASSALALERYGSDLFFLKRQAVFSLIGFFALMTCRYIPYHVYRVLAYPILACSVAFLLAVKVSGLGHAAGGAERWIKIAGFTFQPTELVKPAIVIFLAYSMSKKAELMKTFSVGFVPHILVFGIFAGLILAQPDFGSVVILGMITWIMLFAGGAKISHMLLTILPLVLAGVGAVMMAPYRVQRFLSYLDPWEHHTGAGYQMVHSEMAFGTGGLWGTGIGKGYQKLFYLPEPHTDFIFSVIGEELGLIGVMLILCLFIIIFWRGIQIAVETDDAFGSLVATGLTAVIGLQVCINMGVTLGLLPTKGLTLPFLSYGGTSLIFSMASIGILMNISACRQKTTGAKSKQGRTVVKGLKNGHRA